MLYCDDTSVSSLPQWELWKTFKENEFLSKLTRDVVDTVALVHTANETSHSSSLAICKMLCVKIRVRCCFEQQSLFSLPQNSIIFWKREEIRWIGRRGGVSHQLKGRINNNSLLLRHPRGLRAKNNNPELTGWLRARRMKIKKYITPCSFTGSLTGTTGEPQRCDATSRSCAIWCCIKKRWYADAVISRKSIILPLIRESDMPTDDSQNHWRHNTFSRHNPHYFPPTST